MVRATPSARAASRSLCSVAFGEKTLRIPIAFLLLVESRSPGRSDYNNQIKPINSFNFISFKLLAKKRGANYASLIYTTASNYSITIRLDMPNSDTCIK